MNEEHLDRVAMMAAPGQTKWDLSPNDQSALSALLAMARRLGEVTCQKCKRAFPHNEEMVCMCCNASLVDDACFYENRYVHVGDLTQQLTAATAREDALGSRIMEIADDALGLQEVDSSPIHMLDALEKRFHEHRVEATRAKCADALQATLDEIAHIVGAVHDQMTGPSYPGTNTEVIAAVAAATARAEAAEAELTPAGIGRMRRQADTESRLRVAEARAQAAEKRCGESLISALTLMDDALDFIALVAGTTCTQGPTATHPDYCLKCRADALMRRAGRAR